MLKKRIYVEEEYIKKGEGIGYPPRLKSILVSMIGKENYEKMNGITKVILLREMLEKFRSELVSKHGSTYLYTLDWCKRNGFKTFNDYLNWLSQEQGYKDRNDFLNKMAVKRGYKSWWDERFNGYYKKKIGAKRPIDVVNYWAKKRGFDDWLSYQNFLAVKNGYKDKNHYRRIMYKKKKLGGKNGK